MEEENKTTSKKVSIVKKTYANFSVVTTTIASIYFITNFLRDRQELLSFILDNIVLYFIYLLCIIILSISWTIIGIYWIRFTQNKSYLNNPDQLFVELKSITKNISFRKFLLIFSVTISLLGNISMIAAFIWLNSTNSYYVVIASQPNEQTAIKYIEDLNYDLRKRDIYDYKAYAYKSKNSNWYMITLNRMYFSNDDAYSVLRQARKYFGDKIPKDAYIYESANINFWRKWKNFISKYI